jgi:hypothetical protein
MNLIRQAAVDHADAIAGEFVIPLRQALQCVPDAWDDKQITSLRKFYEANHLQPWSRFDSREKINRLLRRREARKQALSF